MKKVILIVFLLFLQGCVIDGSLINSLVIKETHIEKGPPPEAYFCPKDNCTSVFLNLIEASTDIRCALYDLDLPEIIAALKEKNAKVNIEEDNRLDDFGYGNSYALMHNKFCIFDKKTVMTGSFNPTFNGAYRNSNNLFVIESEHLAENYIAEFREIDNDVFGKGNIVRKPQIVFNNISIENYFCPEDNCKGNVIEELNKAKSSVRFMFFSFTDKDIADKFIELNDKGIDVKGVMEKQRINMQYNKYNYLKEHGIEVYPDNNKYIMHHKVFIIDERTVITGSYNPTGAGNEKNDENILIIQDKGIAKQYLDEFDHLVEGHAQ